MLETIKEQWPAILEHLKQEHDISDVSFKTWLLPLEVVSVEKKGKKVIVTGKSAGNAIVTAYNKKGKELGSWVVKVE